MTLNDGDLGRLWDLRVAAQGVGGKKGAGARPELATLVLGVCKYRPKLEINQLSSPLHKTKPVLNLDSELDWALHYNPPGHHPIPPHDPNIPNQ